MSIGFLFLPSMLSSLVPAWIQQNLLSYLPDAAAFSLGGMIEPDVPIYLEQTPAIISLAIWLTVSLVAASIVLHRRDA